MKKILIIFIIILVYNIVNSNPSEKPKNVPDNAKWNNTLKTWAIGNIDNDYICWYETGVINFKIKRIKSNKIKINKVERYYPNGHLEQIGYRVYIDYLKDNLHGAEAGWQGVGKWREYYESGKIKREWCYSLILEHDAYWTVKPCGLEIFYDENGKVSKQINNKLKCQFDCDKYDPLKNSNFE